MALIQISHADHVNRLLWKLRGKPRLQALVLAILGEFDELEAAAFDLLTKTSLGDAEGEQLDIIGRIVDLRRDTRTDATYRIALRAQLLVLRSSGTTEQLYAIFDTLDPTADYSFEEHFPAKFVITWVSPPLDDATVNQYALITKKAKGGGIGVYLHYLAALPEETFGFWGEEYGTPAGDSPAGDDPAGGYDPDFGYSDVNQILGGVYSGVLFV